MGNSAAGDEAIASPFVARWRLRARVPAHERDLVRAAQGGSADAVEELARQAWPDAFRVALMIVQDRAAAEDVAQEAVLAALDSLHRFNAKRPFAPWLHRIVTNRALDVVRRRVRHTAIDARLEPPAAEAPRDLGLSPDLRRALLALSAEERAAFVLRHLAGMTSREIGQTLHARPSTVRSILRRARMRLATELGPKEDAQ